MKYILNFGAFMLRDEELEPDSMSFTGTVNANFISGATILKEWAGKNVSACKTIYRDIANCGRYRVEARVSVEHHDVVVDERNDNQTSMDT